MLAIPREGLPPGISRETLTELYENLDGRGAVLSAIVQRFEQRYHTSLPELENRLNRGEGSEHPDWEDSIEWRNALDSLQRMRI